MREGSYLGHPPVDVRAVASRRLQHSLMRGLDSYSGAAGGFHQVPAMPRMQTLRAPTRANAEPNVRLVELYAGHPGLFKQRLASMFREPRARVTSGQLRVTIPQLDTEATGG